MHGNRPLTIQRLEDGRIGLGKLDKDGIPDALVELTPIQTKNGYVYSSSTLVFPEDLEETLAGLIPESPVPVPATKAPTPKAATKKPSPPKSKPSAKGGKKTSVSPSRKKAAATKKTTPKKTTPKKTTPKKTTPKKVSPPKVKASAKGGKRSASPSRKTKADSIYAAIAANPNLRLFKVLVDASGSKEVLSASDDVVVLAPTNDAIKKVPNSATLGTSQGGAARDNIIAHHIFFGSDVSNAEAAAREVGIDLATADVATLANGKLYVVDKVWKGGKVSPAPSKKPATTVSKKPAAKSPKKSPPKTTKKPSPPKATATTKGKPSGKASAKPSGAKPPALTVEQAAAVDDFLAMAGIK